MYIELVYIDLSVYRIFQFGHFTMRDTRFTDHLKKCCAYAGGELNKESLNIIERLLSISKTHACFYLGRDYYV